MKKKELEKMKKDLYKRMIERQREELGESLNHWKQVDEQLLQRAAGVYDNSR